MNPEHDPVPEEQLIAWLADYDAARGQASSLPVPDTSAEGQPQLERHRACIALLRQLWPAPADAEAAPPGPAAPADAGAALPHLGRFEVRRELGRGGYGLVFLAYDRELDREVALKIPRPDVLVTPELRGRFQIEARAAAGLDQPNVVPVYEAGALGPVCFIASAYCPGETLAAWLRQRTQPVPFATAAALVAALADAVQHAHSRGVLHRDLKPTNVILSPANAAGSGLDFIPKVTDFGLAKLLEDGPEVPTQSGAVVGTPAYMAPEQAAGQTRAISTAADVYALGVILYEVLTGRPPFQAATALQTLRLVESAEPLPPGRLRPKLPRDLETICLKCLQKDPGRRYASAHALAEDLRRFLAREPVQARPVGGLERLWRWCRRKPALAGVTAALLLALVLGVAGILWQWQR